MDIFLNIKKYTTINCTTLCKKAEKELIATIDKYFLNLYNPTVNKVVNIPAVKLIINPGVNSVPNIKPCINILKLVTSIANLESNFSNAIKTAIFESPSFIHRNLPHTAIVLRISTIDIASKPTT